jgi:hypothetical protein
VRIFRPVGPRWPAPPNRLWGLWNLTGTVPSNFVSLLTLDRNGSPNAVATADRLYCKESSDHKSLYLNYAPTGGFGATPPVPEPGSFALLFAGRVGLLA